MIEDESVENVSSDELMELIGRFVRAVPENERDDRFHELLYALGGIFVSRGTPEPDWLLAAMGRDHPTPIDHIYNLYIAMVVESVRLTMRRLTINHVGGVPAVAREAEIAPSTLRRFLAGSISAPATWSKLAEYSRGQSEGAPDPGLVGLSLLTSELPMRARAGVRSALAQALREQLRVHDVRPVAWVEEECDW